VAKIYISSTYRDLQPHRQAVYTQLVRMQHTVTAMEQYVARDERPVDVCVRDVAKSDLYVGIFAWRYGHVPITENPDSLSVTELEYRAAKAQKIPTLVFLLDDAVAWPPSSFDSQTGEGNAGQRIRDLRARLAQEQMVSFFTSADDLAAKVGAAVHVAGTVTDALDAAVDLAAIVGADVIDRLEMMFSQSYVPHMIDQIARLGDAPLIKVDLRDGNYWWSTRLYALATLAHEYTSVEWLLFLERGNDYVGMVRPTDLRRALVLQQPELEADYRTAEVPRGGPQIDPRFRAGQVLEAMVTRFQARPGGELGFRLLIDAAWLSRQVAGFNRACVKLSGSFDLLATSQLLDASTPYVPIVDGSRLVKVIDRVGVATELARTVVERRLGRA
jgi:hypothetical protein